MTFVYFIVAVILFFWIGLPLLGAALELLIALVVGFVKLFKWANAPKD